MASLYTCPAWLRVALPRAALLAFTCGAVVARGEGLSAADYLSEEHFPGYHILEPRGTSLLVYKDSRRPTSEGKYAPLEIAGIDRWASMDDASAALNTTLAMSPLEPLQSPWSLFDAQGRRLSDVSELVSLPVSFLIMLGQWMWPAVRVGFEQTAEGVLKGSAVQVRTLSLRPVVFQVDGFILPEETKALIDIGKTRKMVKSKGMLITEDKKANRPHNDFRTSTQTWLARYSSSVAQELDDRTANLSRIPASHNEDSQLLRYAEGELYKSHLDWADLTLYNGQKDQWRRTHYGWDDRIATLFWYLNTVEAGGETVFPKHGDPICPVGRKTCPGTTHPSPEACDIGLRVSPLEGRVVLWYNYLPDGRGDQNALHGGCPPAPGFEKWSANKWIHTKPMQGLAPWMPEHPALRRYRWREMGMSDDEADPESTECKFGVKSQLPEAELFWVNQETQDHVQMGRLSAGQETQLNSFHGHTFVVKAGGKTSKPMVCKKPRSKYTISESSFVAPQGTGTREL